jgi:hypothetical protein
MKKKYDYYLYLLDCSLDLELSIQKVIKSRKYKLDFILNKKEHLEYKKDMENLRKYINSINVFECSVKDLEYFCNFINVLNEKYNVGH